MSGHGTTHKDYVRMAMALGGAAWDLNLLRKGGETASAFTKAFIDLKVKEISKQVCERCFCDSPPIPECRPGCLGECATLCTAYSMLGLVLTRSLPWVIFTNSHPGGQHLARSFHILKEGIGLSL